MPTTWHAKETVEELVKNGGAGGQSVFEPDECFFHVQI